MPISDLAYPLADTLNPRNTPKELVCVIAQIFAATDYSPDMTLSIIRDFGTCPPHRTTRAFDGLMAAVRDVERADQTALFHMLSGH